MLESSQHPMYYTYNTLGLAFFKLNKYDSAVYWYRMAIPSALQYKDSVWVGIMTGNIGSVYFHEKKYDSAKYYFLKEYNISSHSTVEKRSPNNSLLMVARILAVQGKADSGLQLIKQAEPFLYDDYYNDNRNLYKAKADVYKALHLDDSADHYSDLFQLQDDSINELRTKSRMDVTLIKLNYEKSQQDIQRMISEKKWERNKQYLLLIGIILIVGIGLFIYRQQVQRSRLEKELLMQEKKTAEEQLSLFTTHIIEKNTMIERLQAELQQQNKQVNDDLISQTILTDDDWTRFRNMFNKARPGLFDQLQEHAPGITPAEIRLAALLSLKLDTKNIASTLGISTDAVRKSKSRLRQRLNITVEDDLENYINSISNNS